MTNSYLKLREINEEYFRRLAVIKTLKKENQNCTELDKLYDKIRNIARNALSGESSIKKITGLLKKAAREKIIPIDKKGYPTEEGTYLATGAWGSSELKEIEVYHHPIKGLCCFAEDFGSGGTGVNDSTDCHVSVQNTGLEFILKTGELKHAMD